MQARTFLLGSTVGLVATAFVIACSGNGDAQPIADGAPDSGADVVVDSARADTETLPADAATCDLAADFTAQIPDASIADGSSTSGTCLQCANTQCKGELDACNGDCTCKDLAVDALGCYLENTTNPILCAANFTAVDSNTQKLGLAIVDCLQSSCQVACATESSKGMDAGPDAD